MVGVPGKYKGCETCRRRRVKCDNTRPLCRKCLDNGRDCEGYHRDRVFITAGIEDGGRCSSHPPRRAGGSGSEKSKSQSPEKPQQAWLEVEEPPGSSAWDDAITLSSRGAQHAVQVVAFHVDMTRIARVDAGDGRFMAEGVAYSMPDFRMPIEGFDMRGQCLAHISGKDGSTSLCAFVYEHSGPSHPPGAILWASGSEGISDIRGQGPEAFQAFPSHHFFARIYRPHAIGQALLSRRGTFLASQSWTSTPWTTHPKTPLDTLLDTLSHIPAFLSSSDTLLSAPITNIPQNALQELLTTAQHIEQRLDAWHAALMPGHWLDDGDATLHFPFGSALSFRDCPSALACIYYWTGLLLFYPCMLELRRAAFPQYGYQADEARYMQGRQLAGRICQSLDFVLSQSSQPDLLVVPLAAVEGFYKGIQEPSAYGTLELVWCQGFRERLAVRGEYLAGLLHKRRWAELGRF